MNGRSTATPTLTISTSAGLMAAALGAFSTDGFASEMANGIQNVAAESATVWRSENDFTTGKEQSADANNINYPIMETWDDSKHKGELKSLILKKASGQKNFTAKDAKRLAMLQQMRRETLPQTMSYEEFVREQDRREELVKLTEALMAYERKYGAIANG